MTHLGHPNKSSKTSEALDIALDLTVEGLEASKDIIVDALSVPGTGIAIDAVIGILKKVQAAKLNHNALKSLREEITLLMNMLQRLAKAVDTELPADKYPVNSAERGRAKEDVFKSTGLVKRVDTLARQLEAICADADKLLKRNRFSRFVHTTGDARAITDMKDKIAAARQAFQIEDDVITEATVTEALTRIKSIIAMQKAEEEERVLNSIPRADRAHYLSDANAMKARLQEGTRERIFESLNEWVEAQLLAAGDSTQPVRVLVGEAGTGKSTVASEFAKRLKEWGLLGASFFFTRGLTDLNSPTKFFSTVAWQLAQSQPVLRRPVVDAARQHLKTGALLQLEIQFKDLVEKPLSSLPEPHPPIFIVVDGLDECTEEGPQLVPSLLRLLLSAAVRPGSPLRVFLASRPEPQYIHDVFTTSDVKPHVSVTSIQEFRNTVDRDIESLIWARLAENTTSKEWSDGNPDAVYDIVDRSDGLFIYARTAVDFILADLDPTWIQRRYDALLRAKQAHGLVPLDTLYRTVLEGVFPPENRLPQMQEDLRHVLGYLVAVLDGKGISPRTLEKLTGMPTSESVPILNKLRSVVIFEQDNVDSRFRIIHATFREFLGDPARAGDDFYVNAVEAHGRLAEGCVSVMRSFAEDWQGTGTDAQARLILQYLTFDSTLFHFIYACRFRLKHLKLRRAPSQFRDRDSCQPVGADDPPPVAAFENFESYANHKSQKMSDLIRTIYAHIRESLPVGSKWTDTLAAMEELLAGRNFLPSDLISHMFIILDIRAVGNRAVWETAQDQTIRTLADLEDQWAPKLASVIKTAYDTGDYAPLRRAQCDLHKAIVAAGLTPGVQILYEE
ncbi:hypothetical protein OH76DRAFT_1398269 [Lentinus brumalis]|uniref:NACHT domain-containing protein n=1 Tax=Lentinus brumalis TaxID=2498619 RepID=A0A371DNA1_9APHY|nr:hypothetical protein OH76DRAFT_1398269 [Polyporus brumalis]